MIGAHAAADSIARFENEKGDAFLMKMDGARESGESCSNDDHGCLAGLIEHGGLFRRSRGFCKFGGEKIDKVSYLLSLRTERGIPSDGGITRSNHSDGLGGSNDF